MNQPGGGVRRNLVRVLSNPVVGAVGTIGTVAGLVLTIVLYLQGQRYPELVYVTHPTPVVLAQPGGQLKVEFKGQAVEADVLAIQIALWNQGKAPIRPEHVLTPLEVRLHPPVRVLEATVSKQSRDVVGLQITETTDLYQQGRVPVTFRILEQGDGGTIQVTYAGVRDVAPQIGGVIEGQAAPRNIGSRPKPPTSPQEYLERLEKRKIFVVVTLIAMAALTGVFAFLAYLNYRRTRTNWRSYFLAVVAQLGAMTGLAIGLYFNLREPLPPFGF